MRKSAPELLVWVLVAGLPAATFLWLETHPAANLSIVVPTGHFYVVSAVSVCSAAIPLEVRVASAADVYDALRSTRSYRKAWTREVALAHMREQSGTHFDPVCIEAFLAVVDRWEAEYSAEAEESGTAVLRPLAA